MLATDFKLDEIMRDPISVWMGVVVIMILVTPVVIWIVRRILQNAKRGK